MSLEPERFWEAFERAGMLDEAAVSIPARAGRAAWQGTVAVDFMAETAPAFEGSVQGVNARMEYRTAALPKLAMGDRVTLRGKQYQVASHPEPVSDGDSSIVEIAPL